MARKVTKKSIKNNRYDGLYKAFITFLVYIVYSYYFAPFLQEMGLSRVLAFFVADFIFMFFIVVYYRSNIKEDFNSLSKNYSIGKLIRRIAIWIVLIFLLNIVMGAITDYFYPNLSIDQNTSSIDKIASLSFIYTAFKTLIFASIAEELLFRESVGKVVKNKFLFILISSSLYTLMNFLYVDLGVDDIGIYVLMYFVPALLMSLAYVRSKGNILFVMLIKFFYNLMVPFTLLVFETLNK